ncbi:MAG: ABC transporter ATP-binding protein [Hyphomonas sp.]|jgi:lipopolysaccharide transport system ATP-binding protein|nr:ABC transporter ATP-binding protein [Hyphomonas sp.]
MSSEIAIRAERLCKNYRVYDRPEDRLKQMLMGRFRTFHREFPALADVDLQVPRGQTTAIIGRNGSGKSTLLQMICGTLSPTSGNLSVTGKVAGLLELGAGFNLEFTGRENIALTAAIYGLSAAELDVKLPDILAFAELGDFIDQPVKTYSSGMYARLGFAVVAHVNADILVVDEILAVGDAAFTQKCMRFVRRFKQNGTLLFTSHDMSSVLALCDHAIWLDAGTVRASGPAKDVCQAYQRAIEGEKSNPNTFKIGGSRKRPPEPELPEDHREKNFQALGLAPQVKLFAFDPDAPWHGLRGATIERAAFVNDDGVAVTSFAGGETVRLCIDVMAHKPIEQPIVGFYLRDRTGQNLVGDNSYFTYRDAPLAVSENQRFSAFFTFVMPYLQPGDYSVVVAMAEGDLMNHLQHHWIDDALFFKVVAPNYGKGLVGIPMKDIELVVHDTQPVG